LFYRYQINTIKKLGYSEKASNYILFHFKKDYVLQVGENKTLNAAFESSDYNEKYIDRYKKIKYQKQEHLIKNINAFIKKKYSNSDISLILSRGSDKDVSEFSKRDRVRYIEEFLVFDFAKLKNYDRYVEYSDLNGDEDEDVVIYVNMDLDKEAYTDAVEEKNYGIDMVVNKHRFLNKKFDPDLVKVSTKYASEAGMLLRKEAMDAYIEMSKACEKDGLSIVINSAYRSYDDQIDTQEFYRKWYGDSYVEKYVAAPGFSEHQTGLAIDVASKSNKTFAASKEYKWMLENSYKYGYIIRYEKKYEHMTLFRAEPWHYRYVGKRLAKEIHDKDITLEEYAVRYLEK
jgi:D-alanyl-D-alanine carboxypeptidase